MSDCLILGDAAVHDLLIGLSKADIHLFQDKLQDILKSFSGGEERQYQPESASLVRPNGQKVLFRPFTSPSSVGTKIIVHPAPKDNKAQNPLHGVLVLLNDQGIPKGIINAEEVTGFRTSLSAIIPWTWRRHTDSVVVFGAGKQALWHIRLALALRGDEIKSVTLINRSQSRAQTLVDQIKDENSKRWKSDASLRALDPSDEKTIKAALTDADAIFCTVPSQEVLFSEADVRAPLGRPPYISAIGSWQPNMIELDPALLQRAVNDGSFHPKAGSAGGVVIVDAREEALSHSGEVIQSGLKTEHLVELGEILDLHDSDRLSSDQHKRMLDWLKNGLLVYKSVGVSLTDLAAGEAILELAKKQGLGHLVNDF